MILLSNLTHSFESYTVTAIIDTALSVGAGGSSGSLADKPIIRNAEGNLIIPASQLKGRLRHECEKLARGLKWPVCQSPSAQNMCPERASLTENFRRNEYYIDDQELPRNKRHHCIICQIFGNPTIPSRVIFDDLVCTEDRDNLPEVFRPGVTLNRRRRTTEEQKLFFLETSPMNALLKFTGQFHLMPNCPDYAKALLWGGLRHINALGGSKSAGLGWLHWEFPAIEVEESVWEFLAKGDNHEPN